MAYDFLKETTYTSQLDDQARLADYLASQAAAQAGTDEETYNTDPDSYDESEYQPTVETDDQPEEVHSSDDTFNNSDDDQTASDIALLDFIFSGSSSEQNPEGAGSLLNAGTVISNNTNLDWLHRKTNNVNIDNLNPNISKYLNNLPKALQDKLVATSGNDDKHATNSRHYHNNALDLRYDQDVYNHIKNDPVAKQLGITTLDPNHGTAPHIHIQTKQYGGKYSVGGNTLYAADEEVQRLGLNNPSYDQAYFPMKGVNTFRGLDNHQPVAVTDGTKYKVLHGPKDTAQFNGNVYESKI